MYYLNKFCCLCLNCKFDLKIISELCDNMISYYNILIICFPEMDIIEINPKMEICKQCCFFLKDVYNFRNMCMNNKIFLKEYVSQLSVSDNSTHKNIYVKLIDLKDTLQLVKRDLKDEKLNFETTTENNILKPVEIRIIEDPYSEIITMKQVINQNETREVNIILKKEILDEADIVPTNKLFENLTESNECSYTVRRQDDFTLIEKENNSLGVAEKIIEKGLNNLDEIEKLDFPYSPQNEHSPSWKNKSGLIKNNNDKDLWFTPLEETCLPYSPKFDDVVLEFVDVNEVFDVRAIEDFNIDDLISNNVDSKIESKTEFGLSVNANHHKKKIFKCQDCAKTFSNFLRYERHCEDKICKQIYKCDKCEKSYTSQAELHRHQVIHTGSRPYKCKDCNKGFVKLSHKIRHERMVHAGEMNYKCKTCNKTFVDASNLRRHQYTHSNLKPFKCEVCKTSFNDSNYAKNHCKFKNKKLADAIIRNHWCNICDKQFLKSSHLFEHRNEVHYKLKIKCSICNKLYYRGSAYRKHQRSHKL